MMRMKKQQVELESEGCNLYGGLRRAGWHTNAEELKSNTKAHDHACARTHTYSAFPFITHLGHSPALWTCVLITTSPKRPANTMSQ